MCLVMARWVTAGVNPAFMPDSSWLKEGLSLEQDPQLVRQERQQADQDHKQHIAHVSSNGPAAFGLAIWAADALKKAWSDAPGCSII
jgi:hypothetical protein